MSYRGRHKAFLNQLDSSVRWTGIAELAAGRPRRRPLRWPSTIVLVLAVAGFTADFGASRLGWGYALLMVGFCLGNFMPIWGPLKPWGSVERADEFDRMLRARAFLAAFTVLTVVAVAGLWAIAGLSALQGWSADTLRLTVIKLAFLLATIYTAGPTCHASWAQLPVDDEAL